MEDIFELIKTLLITETSNSEAVFKYEIFRSTDKENALWLVKPYKKVSIQIDKVLQEVWVNQADKNFPPNHVLSVIIDDCRIHFHENK
ncbi:hypothetical protein [Pantoea ananatis]|uniref:hypothetical protein n=1 Tax=Pantoea ananas TaxID=553 RepID=UPI000CEB6F6E|nr:hypothetical protein [Pantoea ananatis]AVG77967.1 hypothetical protein B9Q16_18860 [Pantoea ananatis]